MGASAPKEELINDSLDIQMLPFKAIAMVEGRTGPDRTAACRCQVCGVMSYVFSQRVREIGIRMALGAPAHDVGQVDSHQRSAARRDLRRIGIAGGAAMSRLLAVVIVDLSPLDPIAFGGLPLSLVLVARMAIYVPANGQ